MPPHQPLPFVETGILRLRSAPPTLRRGTQWSLAGSAAYTVSAQPNLPPAALQKQPTPQAQHPNCPMKSCRDREIELRPSSIYPFILSSSTPSNSPPANSPSALRQFATPQIDYAHPSFLS